MKCFIMVSAPLDLPTLKRRYATTTVTFRFPVWDVETPYTGYRECFH